MMSLSHTSTILKTYPYLISTLFLLFILMVLIIFNRGQRHPIFLSAVLSVPTASASIYFVPEYWNPVRLLNSAIGIEDIIFAFSTGGILWVLGVWPFRNRISVRLHIGPILSRFILCTLIAVLTVSILIAIGIGVMTATLLSLVTVGIVLIRFRPDLWLISLTGSICFTLFYAAFTKTVFLIWPEMILQWNSSYLWGIYIIGLPLEEILWGPVYGAVWPLIMAYSFDLKLDSGS